MLLLKRCSWQVLKERFGVKCILGLTATATMATIRSISHNLGISDCDEATVRGKAMPDNLHLSISRDEEKDGVRTLSYSMVLTF